MFTSTQSTAKPISEKELEELIEKMMELKAEEPKALILLPDLGNYTIHKVNVETAKAALFSERAQELIKKKEAGEKNA